MIETTKLPIAFSLPINLDKVDKKDLLAYSKAFNKMSFNSDLSFEDVNELDTLSRYAKHLYLAVNAANLIDQYMNERECEYLRSILSPKYNW